MRPSRHNQPVGVIVGRRGTGKTTLARSILARFPRVIVVDPNHEYAGEVCESLSALYDVARIEPRFHLVYRPDLGVVGKAELERVDIASHIAWTVGRLLLVIDEADRYTRMGKDTLPFIGAIIHQGRHRGVGLLGIARRPEGLPKDLIGNARWLYCFHLDEPYSQAYLARILGEHVVDLPRLADGQYLVRDELGGVRNLSIALGSRPSAPPRLSIAGPGGAASAGHRQ